MSGTQWLSFSLGFALANVERGDGAWLLVGYLYLPELTLIAHDVLLQCHEQTLGVLRCKDDTAAYLRLWNARKNAGEVNHEVAAGVGYDGKVCVFALRCLLWQLYLELPLLLFVFVFVHIYYILMCHCGAKVLFLCESDKKKACYFRWLGFALTVKQPLTTPYRNHEVAKIKMDAFSP